MDVRDISVFCASVLTRVREKLPLCSAEITSAVAAWGHNNIARGRAGISRRTSLCGCSGASDRVEHCACIVLEHGLERTEVGCPELVEQTLQHNAEIVRAMCRVSKPNGTDVAESPRSRRVSPPASWGTLRTGWSRFHAQFGRFLRDFYGFTD